MIHPLLIKSKSRRRAERTIVFVASSNIQPAILDILFNPFDFPRSPRTTQQPLKNNTTDFRLISTNYSSRVTRTSSMHPRSSRVEDTREHVPVFGTRGPTIAKDARALAAPGRSATPGRVRGPRRRWWMAFEGWSREKERQRGGYGK